MKNKPIAVALIGCGGFVRHTHLKNLTFHPDFQIRAAVDTNEDAAREIGAEAGAAYVTTDASRAINDPEVELVFIATPHHTHAALATEAAQGGKHIYCEKPMGLSVEDCNQVMAAVEKAGVHYMAGYNRALAPFTLRMQKLRRELAQPLLSFHRFADFNPYGHGWLIDESLSGGRLIGEAGHALDFLCRIADQEPERVWAEGGNFGTPSATKAPDSALITVGFPDGSSGTLMLSSVGNNAFPKEEVQVTCANHTAVIRGFETMEVYSSTGTEIQKLPEADKGNWAMLEALAKLLRSGGENPTGLSEALRATRLTLAAVRAIREKKLQHL